MTVPVPGSRVVTVSSVGHRIRARIHFDDLRWERSYDRVVAYGQSKLANLMFTYELQRRLAARGSTIAVPATTLTSHGKTAPRGCSLSSSLPAPARSIYSSPSERQVAARLLDPLHPGHETDQRADRGADERQLAFAEHQSITVVAAMLCRGAGVWWGLPEGRRPCRFTASA